MILVLIAIILAFFVIIVCFYFAYYKQKKTFENRTEVLENSISILGKQQEKQSHQLKLSDSLSEQLKESNDVLSKTIFDMNTDLFSVLFDKKAD